MCRFLAGAVIVCLTAGFGSLAAGAEGDGGQGGAFLRMPAGSRSAGMGNAYVSIADDGNAMYFNPAGLYQVEGYLVSGTYSVMQMDRKQYQGGLVYSDSRLGAFGATFMSFGVSDIEGRDSQGHITETFDDRESAISLGYARELSRGFGVGGSFKYISHSLADNAANAIAFDLGLHSKIEVARGSVSSLRFGVSATDLGAELKWDTASSHKDDVPSTVRLGTAMDLEFDRVDLLVALDGSRTSDEGFELHAGVEAWISRTLALRMGSDGGDVNAGVSVRYSEVQFDYAYCSDVLDEGSTSKIAVQLRFGP